MIPSDNNNLLPLPPPKVVTLPSGKTITLSFNNKVLLSAKDCIAPDGSFTVPAGMGIEIIGEKAFANCLELREIELPEGINTIIESAFAGCSHLIKITLPQSLRCIEKNAFRDCSLLTNVTLPDNLSQLDEGSFLGCNELKQLRLPRGFTNSYPNVVGSHTSLIRSNEIVLSDDGTELLSPEGCIDSNGSFTVPSTVTSIADFAFCLRTDLKRVVLPLGLEYIGKHAFDECCHLIAIELPETVSEIDIYAFEGCDQLKSVEIPRGLVKVDENSFGKGVDLKRCTTMTLSDDGTQLMSPEGCVEPDGSCIIPASVHSISDCAFYDRIDLKAVTLPDTLQVIGSAAFVGCKNMLDITLPGRVTVIGGEAFYGCGKLKKITLPSSLQVVGEGAFDYCVNLDVILIDSEDDDVMRITQLLPERVFYSGSSISKDFRQGVIKKSLYDESESIMAESLREVEAHFDECFKAFTVFLAHNLQSKEEGAELNLDTWRLIACFLSSNRPPQYARVQENMQAVAYPRKEADMPIYRAQIQAIKSMAIENIQARTKIYAARTSDANDRAPAGQTTRRISHREARLASLAEAPSAWRFFSRWFPCFVDTMPNNQPELRAAPPPIHRMRRE